MQPDHVPSLLPIPHTLSLVGTRCPALIGQEAMDSRYHPMFHLRGFALRKSSWVIQRKRCRTASRLGDGNPDHLVAWSLRAVLE